jgi:SAM-dependent methyltransferases related to tRNA (uracil-5-)-methyltransferase
VNRVLVKRAVDMLAPREGERIGDLFCGLGNFSLPLATRGAHVVGMEGSEGLVQRARDNAKLNGLADRTEFVAYDLYADAEGALRKLGAVDKLLIDPPRDGATEICKALPETGSPTRIVYVSCSPATLARDCGCAREREGLSPALRRRGQHVSPHRARGIDRTLRAWLS